MLANVGHAVSFSRHLHTVRKYYYSVCADHLNSSEGRPKHWWRQKKLLIVEGHMQLLVCMSKCARVFACWYSKSDLILSFLQCFSSVASAACEGFHTRGELHLHHVKIYNSTNSGCRANLGQRRIHFKNWNIYSQHHLPFCTSHLNVKCSSCVCPIYCQIIHAQLLSSVKARWVTSHL